MLFQGIFAVYMPHPHVTCYFGVVLLFIYSFFVLGKIWFFCQVLSNGNGNALWAILLSIQQALEANFCNWPCYCVWFVAWLSPMSSRWTSSRFSLFIFAFYFTFFCFCIHNLNHMKIYLLVEFVYLFDIC